MPSTSPKFGVALLVNVQNYAIGVSNTPNSMTIRGITAASGGSLIAANTIPRFVDTDEDPVMQVRISNPTVINNSRIPFVGYPPPFSTGAGAGSSVSQQSPSGASFIIPPGSGLAFQTAAGNTNQVWNMEFVWTEVYLPPSS